MSINLNDILTYGGAKFQVVKAATSKDINTLNNKINELSTIFRKNSTAYAVGSIVFSASLPSGFVLECTTAGTTASTEPTINNVTEGNTISDGTVTWTYRCLLMAKTALAINGNVLVFSNGTRIWVE